MSAFYPAHAHLQILAAPFLELSIMEEDIQPSRELVTNIGNNVSHLLEYISISFFNIPFL